MNGRWEARFRPQSKWELAKTRRTLEAYKGFSNGVYKYEFLNYFDSEHEKDNWLLETRANFNHLREEARARCMNGATFETQGFRPYTSKAPSTALGTSSLTSRRRRYHRPRRSSNFQLDETEQEPYSVHAVGAITTMLNVMTARRNRTVDTNLDDVKIRLRAAKATRASSDRGRGMRDILPSMTLSTSDHSDLGLLNYFLGHNGGKEEFGGVGEISRQSDSSGSEGRSSISPEVEHIFSPQKSMGDSIGDVCEV